MRKPVLAGLDPLRPDPAPGRAGRGRLARLTGAPLVVAATYLHDAITDAVSGGLVEEDLRRTAQGELERRPSASTPSSSSRPGGPPRTRCTTSPTHAERGCSSSGRPRRGRLGRIAPGSTAERLLHGAACPVAVAPAGVADELGAAPDRRRLRGP